MTSGFAKMGDTTLENVALEKEVVIVRQGSGGDREGDGERDRVNCIHGLY